jgi:cytochrome c
MPPHSSFWKGLSIAAVAGVLAASPAMAKESAREAAAARGEALARASCASCHAMGLTDRSPWALAPAFRDMRIDYNAIAYERRMAQMHVGRVRMPPADISLDDVLDIREYVRSLRKARAR